MALKTKSIYDPKQEGDGVRLLVTRFYPRGVKRDRFDRWVRELSPSRELLRAYRLEQKSWEVFRSEFVAELSANPSSLAALNTLRRESRRGNVTLLCYERSGERCHRQIVVEVVRKPKLLGGKIPLSRMTTRYGAESGDDAKSGSPTF